MTMLHVWCIYTSCSGIGATIVVFSDQWNITALFWVVIRFSTVDITKVISRYVHPILSFFQPSIPTPCGTLQRLPQNTKSIPKSSMLTLDFMFWTPFGFPKHKIYVTDVHWVQSGELLSQRKPVFLKSTPFRMTMAYSWCKYASQVIDIQCTLYAAERATLKFRMRGHLFFYCE